MFSYLVIRFLPPTELSSSAAQKLYSSVHTKLLGLVVTEGENKIETISVRYCRSHSKAQMSPAATCPNHKDAVIWTGDCQSGEKLFQSLLQWSRHFLIPLLHAFPVSRTLLRWNYICSDPLPQIAILFMLTENSFPAMPLPEASNNIVCICCFFLKSSSHTFPCSICHLQLTPGMAWLFLLLMLLNTVRVHLTPLPPTLCRTTL